MCTCCFTCVGTNTTIFCVLLLNSKWSTNQTLYYTLINILWRVFLVSSMKFRSMSETQLNDSKLQRELNGCPKETRWKWRTISYTNTNIHKMNKRNTNDTCSCVHDTDKYRSWSGFCRLFYWELVNNDDDGVMGLCIYIFIMMQSKFT